MSIRHSAQSVARNETVHTRCVCVACAGFETADSPVTTGMNLRMLTILMKPHGHGEGDTLQTGQGV